MSINKVTLPNGTTHNLVPGAGDIVVKSKLYFEAVNEDNVTYKKLVAEYVAPEPEDIDTAGTLTVYSLNGNAIFTMDMNGHRFNFLDVVNMLTAGTLRANNLTANRILASDANKNIVSSDYKFDISTNNTSDTWLLVMNGTKIQHRLSTDLSVKNAASATGANYINAYRGDNTAISTITSWGKSFNVLWYSASGKLSNQPSTWGFLLDMGHSVERHQIFAEQANGSLYHRGGNGGSNWTNIPFKTILDSSNYSSYALPLSGGNVTGKLRLNNISELYNSGNTLILGSGDGVSARKYNNLNTYILMSASGFVNQSSRLVKENVEPITEERAKKLLNLNVVTFDYIKEVGGAKNKAGLIAEDTLGILPDIVAVPINYNEEKTKEKIKNNEAAGVMSIDYSKLTPYLVKMVQIQQRQIEELKAEVEKLKDVIEFWQ